MKPEELLARGPLFAQLSAPEVEKVAALLRHRRYRAAEPIFREGDAGTALYIIDKGEVKIVLGGTEGKEVILALLGPGEFFGELALLDGEPRSADAVATVASELLILAREDFVRVLRQVPSIAVSILTVLSRRFRRVDRLVHDAAFSDVRARVTRLLVELAETRGTPGQGGIVIGPRLTQSDLASMIGATRESINKCLRSYTAEGVIRHQRGVLVILNVARLRGALP